MSHEARGGNSTHNKSKAPGNSGTLLPVADILPGDLPLIPVSQTTLFPGMVVPFILPDGKLSKTAEFAIEKNGYIGVVLSRNAVEGELAHSVSTSPTGLPAEGSMAAHGESAPKGKGGAEFHRFGVAAKILKKINLPDNQISLLVAGIQRFEIKKVLTETPHYIASVNYLHEQIERGTELEAMLRAALSQFKQLSKDNPLISEEVKVALVNIDGPGKLADFMASVLLRDVEDYQTMLSLSEVKGRLQHLLLLLKKEGDVQSVQRKIQDEIGQKISTAQREYYLNEQLKQIQKELGRFNDDKSKVIQKFRDRLKDKKLSKEVSTKIEEDFEKLGSLHEQSSEYSVLINYVDWVTSLPWGVRSEENYDLGKARKVLEADHYGLKDVKTRILEFLAVKKLKKTSEGSILCFVGPPGTGKTSLGKSIARALDRKFFRFSVGGMRDEAEIKGHRRTYVGAMPGKMIQGLKRVSTQNPVFLIDEVDKIGTGWASGGDPASALLELLDPEQNGEFLDHYLDMPFDCSEVFFITTANTVDTIPHALLDRMEIIHLSGYTDTEKVKIAQNHLFPKQLKKNALTAKQLKMSDSAFREIAQHYAREAGVRNLEKQLAKICRKVAYKVALGSHKPLYLKNAKDLVKFLGAPHHEAEAKLKKPTPGVATGLAWTNAGGEVLSIESMSVEGRGGFVLTGTLGKVMQESASIGYTIVRDRARRLGLPRHYFDRHVLHLHVPNGATPKDGPSAGTTIATSFYSLLSKQPIPEGIAMTGELTLSGRVLPVGGIKEKLLAAKRNQFHTVILPKANEKELKEIDPEIKKGLKILKVADYDDVIRKVFPAAH